jgi:hypothetical protein
MSFLGDIFSAVGDGIGGMLGGTSKAIDDAAHLDFNGVGEDIQDIWDSGSIIPGSPTAVLSSLYGGFNGDLSWNPYDPYGRSVWDVGAEGTRLSNDPTQRLVGRAIGTAIGSAFTGGALSGAMGSSVAGGAASGALWGGAQSGLSGGSFGEGAIRGGLSGGAAAGIGNAISGVTSGYDQIPEYLRGAINGGLTGGTLSALQGNGFQSGLESGAARGAFGQAMGYFTNNNGSKPVDTWGDDFGPEADTNYSNEGRNYSTPTSIEGSPVNSQAPQLSFIDRLGQVYNDFAGKPGGTPQSLNNSTQQQGNPYVNAASTLASLYSAYRGMKGNGSYLNSLQNMYGQNSPYAQQLQQELARRDAASGRRSQYGTRSVELQAALAKANAGMAPAIMQGQQNDFNNKIRLAQMLGNSLSSNGAFSPSSLAGMYTDFQGLFGDGGGW